MAHLSSHRARGKDEKKCIEKNYKLFKSNSVLEKEKFILTSTYLP
jgi:hypothetical protein